MTLLRDLWNAADSAPVDAGPKLALADLYEERGDESMAYALRWCAVHKKWPEAWERLRWQKKHKSYYRWLPLRIGLVSDARPCMIPKFWFDRMAVWRHWGGYFHEQQGKGWSPPRVSPYNSSVALTTARLIWRLGQVMVPTLDPPIHSS